MVLVVSEVPELFGKLRQACRKKFPQVSSKSASVTSSYLNKNRQTDRQTGTGRFVRPFNELLKMFKMV